MMEMQKRVILKKFIDNGNEVFSTMTNCTTKCDEVRFVFSNFMRNHSVRETIFSFQELKSDSRNMEKSIMLFQCNWMNRVIIIFSCLRVKQLHGKLETDAFCYPKIWIRRWRRQLVLLLCKFTSKDLLVRSLFTRKREKPITSGYTLPKPTFPQRICGTIGSTTTVLGISRMILLSFLW